MGMTCAFDSGWWRPLQPGDLPRLIGYLGKPPLSGTRTAQAYAELWRESKGVHWTGTSGCWKVASKARGRNKAVEVGSLDHLQGGEAGAGHAALFEITPELWGAMPREAQRALQVALCNPLLDTGVIAEWVGSLVDGAGIFLPL